MNHESYFTNVKVFLHARAEIGGIQCNTDLCELLGNKNIVNWEYNKKAQKGL